VAQEEEEEEEEEEESNLINLRRRRRRSLLRIIHARGAIPNEMGPTRCRATPALNQSADEIRTPEEESNLINLKR